MSFINVGYHTDKIQSETIFMGSPCDHQENMYCKSISPYTPFLPRKTGVYRGISNFLIFDPKHSLWVLVRTALVRWF